MEVGVMSANSSLATKTIHGFVFTSMGTAVHFGVAMFASVVVTLLYFRRAERGATDILRLATTVTLGGLLLDLAIAVPAFIHDYGVFFSRWTVYATFGLTFATVCAAGVLHRALPKTSPA
jgi:hypothetical protein